ncbi:MAG: DNA polymerase/3'-5' exonuclease PolX [Halanaerobiales bacterium]
MDKFTNKEVADILHELADLMEIKGENKFKIRAYQNAARKLTAISEDIKKLVEEDKLQKLDGIGSGIASTIKEIFENGCSSTLEELRNELPAGVQEMTDISGLGPKSAHRLFYELGIQDINDLREALMKNEVQKLKGFGAKSEKRLLKSLEKYQHYSDFIRLNEAKELAGEFSQHLYELVERNDTDIISDFKFAGELRRKKELIKNFVLILVSSNFFKSIKILKNISTVNSLEKEDESQGIISTNKGFNIKYRFVKPGNYPAALLYYTGSRTHREKLKKRARKMNMNLKAKGVFNKDGVKIHEIKSESDIYKNLGLQYIPPELREDRGEVEAAEKNKLPELIDLDDIKGDMHLHSNFSDGAYSIEDMARAARRKGYQYIAITDHSQSLRVAHGMSVEKVIRQRKKIEELNNKLEDIYIFNGIEVDILQDGSLDYSNEILESFELVIASVHSGFQQDKDQMTTRIIKAMECPYVDIIGHPQGRLLGKRTSYKADMNRVIKMAGLTNTCLEINASPSRLDLDDKLSYLAKKEGVKLVINTDAHHIKQLEHMELGVSVARRGWMEAVDVLNTKTLTEIKDYLKIDKR